MSARVRPNGLDYPRLGLVIPKNHLARAVDRNRAKRLLREWFRRNQARLRGCDVVVRVSTRPAELQLLIMDMERLFAAEQ